MSSRVGNAGQVRTAKMPRAYFEQIDKDPDVLYFVNDTGTFDPLAFDETDGDIYLGDKLLTAKPPRLVESDTVVWVASADPVHEESFVYSITKLNAAGHIEINAALVLGNTARTQRQAVFYLELCKVTEGQSEGLGLVPAPVYTVEQVLAATYLELPAGNTSQIRLANAHLHAVINGTREGQWALRVRWAVSDSLDGLLQPFAYFPDGETIAPVSKLDVVAWQLNNA